MPAVIETDDIGDPIVQPHVLAMTPLDQAVPFMPSLLPIYIAYPRLKLLQASWFSPSFSSHYRN